MNVQELEQELTVETTGAADDAGTMRSAVQEGGVTSGAGELRQIAVGDVRAAKDQARKTWNPQELHSLADSIRTQGILQPLVVRVLPEGTGGKAAYGLVAGERRLRAAKMAGLSHVPAIVRQMDDEQALLAGLVENLQRANLSPLEEGEAFARALELPGYSYRTLGEKLGLERINKGYIEERVRAHRADPDVRQMIAKRPDSLTHARVISSITDKAARAKAIQATLSGASLKDIKALRGTEQVAKTADATGVQEAAAQGAVEEKAAAEVDVCTVPDPVDTYDTDARGESSAAQERTPTVEETPSTPSDDMPVSGHPDREGAAPTAEQDALLDVPQNTPAEENGAVADPHARQLIADPHARQLIAAVRCFHQTLAEAKVPADADDLAQLRGVMEQMDATYVAFWDVLFTKE